MLVCHWHFLCCYLEATLHRPHPPSLTFFLLLVRFLGDQSCCAFYLIQWVFHFQCFWAFLFCFSKIFVSLLSFLCCWHFCLYCRPPSFCWLFFFLFADVPLYGLIKFICLFLSSFRLLIIFTRKLKSSRCILHISISLGLAFMELRSLVRVMLLTFWSFLCLLWLVHLLV